MKNMIRTTIEETQDICSLCGGRGQLTMNDPSSTAACSSHSCRQCGGVGHIVSKRVVRTEQINTDEITDIVLRDMGDRLRSSRMRLDVTTFGKSGVRIREQ